jgi:leucyl-tRNA synthetase
MVTLGGSAMSKSKGNIVDPDDLIKKYGADTVRLFILFAAPPEKNLEWDDRGIEGVNRFLFRIWNLFHSHIEVLKDECRAHQDVESSLMLKLNQTIKKVTDDIDVNLHLNTAVAALMEFFNEFILQAERLRKDNPGFLKYCFENFLKLLLPFAPHFCNELWGKMGNQSVLENERWPEYDVKWITSKKTNIMIQINGKIRGKIEVDIDEVEENVKELAFKSDRIIQYIKGKKIVKYVFVKNKMLSIVIK